MRPLPRFTLPEVPATHDHWELLRRPPRHTDDALTGTTRAWLRKLPAGRRPQRLCMQFPRVANLVAWHWRDPVQVQQVLEDLLHDRRGGRAGFPPSVVHELRRLRELNDRLAETEAPAGHYLDMLRRFWRRH